MGYIIGFNEPGTLTDVHTISEITGLSLDELKSLPSYISEDDIMMEQLEMWIDNQGAEQ